MDALSAHASWKKMAQIRLANPIASLPHGRGLGRSGHIATTTATSPSRNCVFLSAVTAALAMFRVASSSATIWKAWKAASDTEAAGRGPPPRLAGRARVVDEREEHGVLAGRVEELRAPHK
jgi:hypothetical protein